MSTGRLRTRSVTVTAWHSTRHFAESGLDWSWDERTYGELLQVAGGVERMVHYARVYRGAAQSDEELQTLVLQVHAKKTRHYVQCVHRGAVQLRPGVARLIGQARAQGLQLAIATTTTRETSLLCYKWRSVATPWIGFPPLALHRRWRRRNRTRRCTFGYSTA